MPLSFLRLAFVSWFLFAGFLAAKQEIFPRPTELLPNIRFWTNVYSKWTTDQVILSDSEDLNLVYQVIEVPPLGRRTSARKRNKIIKTAKKKLVKALDNLERIKPRSVSEVKGLEREVYLALKGISRRDKYRQTDSIRAQSGLRDRFELGYRLSGAHEEEIKARLRQSGLPEELIAIAFVESLFFVSSRSQVGAAGIWQLMPRTARQYLHVNRLVDERYDPIIATEAAIEYIKDAKERLEEWPLVITSYNHGRNGMVRAVKKVGSTKLADIIKKYKSRRFGFASKNFYAEFLAALDVYKNAKHYFPESKPDDHWAYSVVEIPKPISANDLVLKKLVKKNWLFTYNPALTRSVRRGKEVVPAGFKLRIPQGENVKFYKKFQKISKKHFDSAKKKIRARHRANGRQRVYDIAKKYDIFHHQLARRLGWSLYKKPKRGQVILLRSMYSRFTEIPHPIFKVEPDFEETLEIKESLALVE